MLKPIFHVIIAGSRDFTDFELLTRACDYFLSNKAKECEIVVISGGCRGADKLGEDYADLRGYKWKDFPAKWRKDGKLDLSAGPRRNRQMVQIADALIVFDSGGNGSRNVREEAEKKGIPVRRIRV